MLLLFIYSLDKKIFEGKTYSVTLPTNLGEITILPGHATLAASLSPGKIKVKEKNSEEKTFFVSGGFVYTDGKDTVVLSHDHEENAF
jgi:F-type H+-transporting ATPase subunit epsilon